MALTRLDHTGNGVTTVYDLAFTLGYLQESDIYVSLDSNSFDDQLGFSFLNKTQIVLDSPVQSGVGFNIRRVVDRDKPINDYEEGAILRESNLDDSFLQPLMIQQEIEDGYITVDQIFAINAELDVRGHKIVNVADPEDDTDATNKQFVENADSVLREEVLAEVLRVETEAVKVAGDTMTGTLSGVDAVNAQDFMPRLQIINAQDNAIQQIHGIIQPGLESDYGFITNPVTAIFDYGTLQG